MIRFHQALQEASNFAAEHFADKGKVYAIRDVVGRISLALNVVGTEIEEQGALSRQLNERLGAFGPGPDDAVQTRDDLLFPEEIFDSNEVIELQNDAVQVYLVDRLMNNQDWLRKPLRDQAPLPTAVAFSLKGGVGRSTTMAAWAHHLADCGYKVLAVDLDLEAPGLQSLLIRENSKRGGDRRPDFGMVDWLVEGRVGQADSALFEEMLSSVDLVPGVSGEIHVIPAFGRETRDYVAKLGRSYFPMMQPDGAERGFAEAVCELLKKASNRDEPFDIALLDARAGMHDIGAAAVTRLGAHAFLFARDDRQTWAAYQHLFEHLRWSPAIEYGMPDHDLRWRLSTVGAMTGGNRQDLDALCEHSFAAWQWLYDEEETASPATPDKYDESMPHWPLPIQSVEELRGASFHTPEYAPASHNLERAYASFFEVADQRLLGSARENP